MHWAIILGVALVSDILDYFGGAIPIVGDVLDLITIGILFPFLGIERSALGFIELVPGADFLPTYTALALWVIWQEYQHQGSLQGLDIPQRKRSPVLDE